MFNRRPELFLTAAATLCAPAALCAQSPSQADTSTHKAPAVSATEPAPPALDTAAGDRWAVRIEPQVWFVGAAGNLQMPGSPAGTPDVKLRSIGADDPEASPAARLTIRVPHRERDDMGSPTFWNSGWSFTVGGASLNADGAENAPAAGLTIGPLTIAGGTLVRTEVDWATFNASVGKWLTGSDFESGGDTRVDLYAVAGTRIHTQDITVSSGGASTDSSETFASLLLGIRLDIKLPGDLAAVIDANVNFWPGDPFSFGYEISPTFLWQPTPNIGVELGYRLLVANNETGDDGDPGHYKLNGSLAGLFTGIEIRF